MAEIWDWHNHHEVICEPRTGPIENRLDYIRERKPKREVETRLRLIAPVTVELPAALVKAQAAYDKARAAYDKTGAAYDKAWAAWADDDKARAAYDKAWVAYVTARAAYVTARAAYDKAWADAAPELERLHALDCPAALAGTCPWDGTTIFPEP